MQRSAAASAVDLTEEDQGCVSDSSAAFSDDLRAARSRGGSFSASLSPLAKARSLSVESMASESASESVSDSAVDSDSGSSVSEEGLADGPKLVRRSDRRSLSTTRRRLKRRRAESRSRQASGATAAATATAAGLAASAPAPVLSSASSKRPRSHSAPDLAESGELPRVPSRPIVPELLRGHPPSHPLAPASVPPPKPLPLPRQSQPHPPRQSQAHHVFAASSSASSSASFASSERGPGGSTYTRKNARQYEYYVRAVTEKEREDEQEALFREARVRMEGEMARQRELQAAAEAARQRAPLPPQQQQQQQQYPHHHQQTGVPRAGGPAAELGPAASRAALRKMLLERGWDESVLSLEHGQPLPNPAAGDPYVILGLSRDADGAEIRKRYRKLALLFHPDKNTRPGANECFCAFSHAYRLLSG
jgi:hypothetical protein